MVKIDKGIVLPGPRGGNHNRYPWDVMDVGDSFVGEESDFTTVQSMIGVQNRKLRPKRFASRIVTENGQKQIRVWRIA